MKRILALLLFSVTAFGQSTNPQPNFSTTVAQAAPASWIRFNGSSATSFSDVINPSNPFSTSETVGLQPASPTAVKGYFQLIGQPLPTGVLSEIKLGCPSTPSGTLLITLGTVTAASGTNVNYTISSSFYVTPTSACVGGVQTFVAGTDYSPVSVTAGEYLGVWQLSSGSSYGQTMDSGPTNSYYIASASAPSGTVTMGWGLGYTISVQAIVTGPAAVTPLQPGFDSAQANNYSVSVPYNGWISAPNTTIDNYEWSTPSTVMAQVDNLSYARGSQPLVLWSKGDIVPGDHQPYQELYVQMTDAASQLCYTVQGQTPGLGGANVNILNICTGGGFDAMPNGFNYNIEVTNSGDGWYDGYTLWINGIPVGGPYGEEFIPSSSTAQYDFGFDPALITITAGGSGYAATTAFTFTGGGLKCVGSGTLGATSGVINSIGYLRTSGCTSNPTVVLTLPTGTGATFSTSALTSTVLNSFPLMIGSATGMSTNSSQASVDVDELAVFPTDLSAVNITNIFYWTTFYQNVLGSAPTIPPVLIVDNDAGDPDNQYALAGAIGMDLKGYLKLEGINNSAGDSICMQMWQQQIDQAGLNNIPLTTSASSYTSGGCNASDVDVYNPSVPVPALNSSTAMYRKVFAANPTRPIYVQLTGAWTGMAAFMASGPDSISSLTGLQLMTQNATNGGGIYAQGAECIPAVVYVPGNCSATITGDNSLGDPTAGQYVLANQGTTPIYWYGGVPASTGPGVQWSRLAKDPLYLYGASHVFYRQAYDSLPLAGMLTPIFSQGVFLTVTGGTGFANLTQFYSTGGGPKCNVQGYMVSSSGVPTGFENLWQVTQDTYSGIGYGCISAPTIHLIGATGSGETITTASTAVCGTASITTGGTPTLHVSSSSCTNDYFLPYSVFSEGPGVGSAFPMFTGYLNSFIDPPPTGQPRVQQQ